MSKQQPTPTAVTPAPAVGTAAVPATRNASFASEMFEDAATLAPSFDRDELTIPFIRVLQDMSPQAKPRDPAYVTGAQAGDFLHVVTKRLWKGETGMMVLPVHYERRHIEWKVRESGGGFVKDHGFAPELAATCTRDDKNRDRLDNGNQLVQTALYYLLVLDLTPEGKLLDVTEAVLSLTSTQLKVARMWNTMMRGTTITDPVSGQRRPAMSFYRSYRLRTRPEENDKGSWMGLVVEPGPTMEELMEGVQLYGSAKHLRTLIVSGARKAKVEEELTATVEAADDGDVPF